MMRRLTLLLKLCTLFLVFIILPSSINAYSSQVIINGHMVYFDKGVDRTIYEQVIKFIPVDCSVRIDVVTRNNIMYDGYAWYSGRITVYDGNNMDNERKQYVLMHEVGHVCASNNRVGSYADREYNADKYAMEMIKI